MLSDARFGAQQRKYMALSASPQAPGQRLKLRLCFYGGRLLTHLPEQFRAVQSSPEQFQGETALGEGSSGA